MRRRNLRRRGSLVVRLTWLMEKKEKDYKRGGWGERSRVVGRFQDQRNVFQTSRGRDSKGKGGSKRERKREFKKFRLWKENGNNEASPNWDSFEVRCKGRGGR